MDAKGGGMEVIDVDNEDEDEDEEEVEDNVNAGDDDGNATTPAADAVGRTEEGCGGGGPPPANPLSRSRDRRGRRPPVVALQLLRRAAVQSPADDGTSIDSISSAIPPDDGTSRGSIRDPGGGCCLDCQHH